MTQPRNTRTVRPTATIDRDGTPKIGKVAMIVALVKSGVPVENIALARDLTDAENVAVLDALGTETR